MYSPEMTLVREGFQRRMMEGVAEKMQAGAWGFRWRQAATPAISSKRCTGPREGPHRFCGNGPAYLRMGPLVAGKNQAACDRWGHEFLRAVVEKIGQRS